MFNQVVEFVKARLGRKGNLPNEEYDTEIKQDVRDKRGFGVDNNNIRIRQIRVLAVILSGFIAGLVILTYFVQKNVTKSEIVVKPENVKIDLADKVVDGEKMWRNHYEDELKKISDDLNDKLKRSEDLAKQNRDETLEETKRELEALKEQLKMARAELAGASGSLQEVVAKEEKRLSGAPPHLEPALDVEDFKSEIELDIPKSAKEYVPEGTYFTGYLMGGIVVSTALSTPDENATPLSIRLKGRGNLAPENDIDISKCRIIGSAYGDLSSERAIIRLEKLICEKNGMYITSSIVGDIHGPDGFNGIKGEVIATGSKHIKNAMIGGIISGLSSSVKGQDAVNIATGGLASVPKKGFKDMAKDGVLSGVNNAGEKIADYYLRQAEAMSPVLTIPGGVRVNAHITKGFFMGEVGTHNRLSSERKKLASKKKVNNDRAVKDRVGSALQEDGSDDGWK